MYIIMNVHIALLYFILNVGPSILQAVKKYAQSTDSRYIHVIIMYSEVYMYVLVNERKKEASKVKQTTRQSNTTHPRQSLTCIYTCIIIITDVYACCGSMSML